MPLLLWNRQNKIILADILEHLGCPFYLPRYTQNSFGDEFISLPFLFMENNTLSIKYKLVIVLVINLIFNFLLKSATYTPNSFPLWSASYGSIAHTFWDSIILILILQIALDGLIFYFLKERMKEKGEKLGQVGGFFLFLASFTLINAPIVGVFIIYSIVKDGKITEKEKTSELEETEDVNYNKPPSEANTVDIKRWLIAGWVMLLVIILISFLMKEDTSTTSHPSISVTNDLIAHKSPIIMSTYTGWKENEYYQEFINNRTETIHTREYPKSNWIDLNIQYPKSWKVAEWLRPNVITYTSSKIDNNWRQVAFNILIKDNTAYLTNDSLKRKDANVFAWEDGWIRKDTGYIILEKQPFIWNTYEISTERNGLILYSYGLMYSTIIKDKLVQIQFFTVWNKKEWLEQYFESNIGVFDLIINSTIINSLYK